MPVCSVCSVDKVKEAFSKSQLKKKDAKKCLECAGGVPNDSPQAAAADGGDAPPEPADHADEAAAQGKEEPEIADTEVDEAAEKAAAEAEEKGAAEKAAAEAAEKEAAEKAAAEKATAEATEAPETADAEEAGAKPPQAASVTEGGAAALSEKELFMQKRRQAREAHDRIRQQTPSPARPQSAGGGGSEVVPPDVESELEVILDRGAAMLDPGFTLTYKAETTPQGKGTVVRVKKIRKGSLADGKLEVGDFILSVGGIQLIRLPTPQCKPLFQNRMLKMVVRRPAGSAKAVPPTQTALRSVRLSRTAGQSLGFDVRIKKVQDFWTSGSAVSVSAVADGGLGHLAGVKVDDRILEINGLKLSATPPKTVIELLRRPELTLLLKAPMPTREATLSRGATEGAGGKADTGECIIC